MIGRTNVGGGAGLNFKVVGNPQPSNPVENTIWIDTDTPITSYIFSAVQPEGEEGMVWIATGTTSTVEFNALKKNGITVYPLGAKQYVSGAWVDKTAEIYQNGEWVGLILLTVAPNTEIAWETSGVTVTQNSDNTVFHAGVGDATKPYAYLTLELTNYKTLKIVGDAVVTSTSGGAYIDTTLAICKSNGSVITGFSERIYGTEDVHINNTYDVSSLSGNFQIRFAIARGASDTTHYCTLTATSIELF